MEKFLSNRKVIIVLLFFQVVPLIMFSPNVYSFQNQEWWLSAILSICALIAAIRMVTRPEPLTWTWYLIGFAQGFNIISRLLMLFPHAIINVEGQQLFNTSYVVISILAMLLSAFLLWYIERPSVRMGLYSN